jgi:hypothetical protein
LSEHSVDLRARVGEGIVYAAERERIRKSHRSEAELVEAIAEDEVQQGRPMTPTEREAFARGFFGQEYAAEVRLLAAEGLLDSEAEDEE